MRTLQITRLDLMGQRFNGYRLHRSLRSLGHESRMLVLRKQSDDPHVHDYAAPGRWFEIGVYAAERVSSLQGMLSPLALTFPFRQCFRDAEVVHWHLIYPHYVGLPWMPFAAGLRPTVWTLHDPWAMTGHCVHPLDCERWRTGCGHCPDLKRNFTVWFDTTALVWRVKRWAYGRAPITLVVASPWMKRHIEASPLLASLPCHVIPFGLDLGTWRVVDRDACRARLGIPPGAKVIAFRVPGGAKHRYTKGVPWLKEALRRLEIREPTCLMTFEDRGVMTEFQDRYRILDFGWVGEEHRLVEALTAADVFVMPSLAESFGMMALEAMACGVPVIATAGTAVADTVRPPEAGLAVPAGDGEALAHALRQLLGDEAARRAMGAAGRRIVKSEYSYDRYVERHVNLYRALAERRSPREIGAA
jgi:glycosyltransferase involved in cell wall biosynthesis